MKREGDWRAETGGRMTVGKMRDRIDIEQIFLYILTEMQISQGT